MVFSSISFLVYFFPFIYLIYTKIDTIQGKNRWLLIVSLLFYALAEPTYFYLFLLCCFITYQVSKKMHLHPSYFYGGCCFLLFVLCYFKFQFAYFHHTLPVGISFYMFQLLSYLLDCYHKQEEQASNIEEFMLYISFFPQLVAGPIVKYHDIHAQFTNRQHTKENLHQGRARFLIGLSKKVIIADTLALVVDEIYQLPCTALTTSSAWLAAILYPLLIYYDFSGYSDMAIGLGKIFGFHIHDNFKQPYKSRTLKEFWTRWHISLSSWFKEYVYLPLGGNRKGKQRMIMNKMLVFFLTGLWHGASINFILWGLLHGIFVCLEEVAVFKKITKELSYVYVMFVIVITFIFFRTPTFVYAITMLKVMFINISSAYHPIVLTHLNPYMFFIMFIAIIGIVKKESKLCPFLQLCLFLYCILCLVSNQYHPFIYFRF